MENDNTDIDLDNQTHLDARPSSLVVELGQLDGDLQPSGDLRPALLNGFVVVVIFFAMMARLKRVRT